MRCSYIHLIYTIHTSCHILNIHIHHYILYTPYIVYHIYTHTLHIQELKVALGLLLKHRGGPGFGHGRLDGPELTHMSVRLRNIAVKLSEEAVAHL